jgi:hypothetical protein
MLYYYCCCSYQQISATITNILLSSFVYSLPSFKMVQDHPDSKLFPHATGAAEKMVQEHLEVILWLGIPIISILSPQ